MTALRTAYVSLVLALGAACANEHTGIPAVPPFDPTGSEPSSADGGTGSGGVGTLFCAQSCKNVEAACGFTANPYCPVNCLMNITAFPACTAELLAYFACLATTNIDCGFGFPQSPACDPALQEANRCQNGGGLLQESRAAQ